MRANIDARAVAALVVVAGANWLVLGARAIPVVLVLTGVVAVEGIASTARHAALAAGGCVVLAAFATIIEHPLGGEPTLQFATNRPFTNAVSAVAGGLLLGSVVFAWMARREDDAPGVSP